MESLWTDLLGVEFAQRHYDANGVRTRVLEAGDPANPALFFLHGVNGHAATVASPFRRDSYTMGVREGMTHASPASTSSPR